MIDSAKRRTLKLLSAAGVGGAALGSSSIVAALGVPGVLERDVTAGVADDLALASISVNTRISSTTNDIEVVLTNSGSEATTITQLTPSRIDVGRGEFDFSSLLKDGALHLQAGQSVSLPLQARSTGVVSDHLRHSPASLLDHLRKTMSVVTDGNAYASITLAPMTAVA